MRMAVMAGWGRGSAPRALAYRTAAGRCSGTLTLDVFAGSYDAAAKGSG